MSLFGPTVVGGGSGSSGSGSASGSGGMATGLATLALRVSQDGSTLEFQRPDGSWATTGLPLETAHDAAGNALAVTIQP